MAPQHQAPTLATRCPAPSLNRRLADEALMSDETIAHVTALVRQHGSDCWWTMGVEQLLPPSLQHLAPRLRKVGAGEAGGPKRGEAGGLRGGEAGGLRGGG